MSREQALGGELSVRDSLFKIVGTICEAEIDLTYLAQMDEWIDEWASADHFPAPMSLDYVKLKSLEGQGVEVQKATLVLPDLDMEMTIDRESPDLNSDAIAIEYFLKRFKMYPDHDHALCHSSMNGAVPSEEGTLLVRLRNTRGDIVLK